MGKQKDSRKADRLKNNLLSRSSYDNRRVLSLTQMEAVSHHAESIISNLDDIAFNQLLEGYEKDTIALLEDIFKETEEVLFNPQVSIKTASFGYLDKLTDALDEELKIRSINYFISQALPNFDMNLHHVEWGNLSQFYVKLALLAARDHGKSYFYSFALPIWKMYRYRRNNKYLSKRENNVLKRGMIITNEQSLANDFLKFIKEEIEANDLLRERLYPVNKDGKWAGTEIDTQNGVNLKVKGIGSSLRGRHPGWIICDDILDDGQLYSKDQRDKLTNLFHGTIMNMLLPGGQAIVVGTPFHDKDLYYNLKHESKGWRVFEYPAIYPDGTLLWQDRYGIEELIDKKDSQGSLIFSREILVKPIVSDAQIFPMEFLKRSFIGMEKFVLVKNRLAFPKEFKKISVGCDFAFSATVGSDYTVYTIIGVDERNNYWLLYMWRKLGASYHEQIAKLKSIRRDFRPDVIMAEDNAAQSVLIDMANDEGLGVIPHTTTTNKYDLKTGLPALSALFETYRMRFPRGDQYSKDVGDIYISELAGVTWTEQGKLENVTDHDDSGMSLWLAVRGANYINKNLIIDFV